MPQFPAIPNLTSNEVFHVDPFDFPSTVPADTLKSKEKRRAWQTNSKTQHAFFSGVYGVDRDSRVVASNPAAEMIALVVDYDSPMSARFADDLADRIASRKSIPPTYYNRTLGGNVRMVWMFEEPIPVLPGKWYRAFIEAAEEALHLHILAPGIDKCRFNDYQYYEVGSDWVQYADSVIPWERTTAWAAHAHKHATRKAAKFDVPLDVIWKQLRDTDSRFVERWPQCADAPFQAGDRGVRWWDDDATRDDAVVIAEDGLICYTGRVGFRRWTSVLGADFVRQHTETQLGAALRGYYYDGRRYYMAPEEGEPRWHDWSLDDMRRELHIRHGLSKRADGDEPSQMDQALQFIARQNRVTAAIPMPHFPPGIHTIQGARILNISMARPTMPADEPAGEWGEKFPTFAWGLDEMMTEFQRDLFLAWLRHFYVACLEQKPNFGQALYLVGPSGFGKTVLSTVFVSAIVGGHVDASLFLTSETDFSEQIFNQALLTVDDSEAKNDNRTHANFSSKIKRLMANASVTYHAKHKAAQTAIWRGRIIITMNDDVQSMRMLPDLERSTADKSLGLFLRPKSPTIFNEKNIPVVLRELPAFCRWLVDWTPPDRVINHANPRFHVVSHIDDELIQADLHNSDIGSFSEGLALWQQRHWSTVGAADTVWEGNASELRIAMQQHEDLSPLLPKVTPRLINRAVDVLINRRYPGLTRTSRPFEPNIIHIDRVEARYGAADASKAPTGDDPVTALHKELGIA